jgi:hypothetical protein
VEPGDCCSGLAVFSFCSGRVAPYSLPRSFVIVVFLMSAVLGMQDPKCVDLISTMMLEQRSLIMLRRIG